MKGMRTIIKSKTTTRQSQQHLAKKIPRKAGLSLTMELQGQARRDLYKPWREKLVEKECF